MGWWHPPGRRQGDAVAAGAVCHCCPWGGWPVLGLGCAGGLLAQFRGHWGRGGSAVAGGGGGVGDEGKVRVQRRKGGGKSRAQGGLSARFWGPWVQLQAEDPDSSPGHTGLGRPDGGGAGGRALWPASVTHPWEPCAGTEMHGEQAEASPAPRPPPVRAGLTLMRQQKRPRSDGGAGRGRRGQPSERPSDNGLLTETTGTGNVQPLL